MEVFSPENPNDPTTREISHLLRRLIHFRMHLDTILPAHLLTARTRLVETYPGGSKVIRPADRELLFRVGDLLANRPEAISMGELSRDLGVPLSTATRIVDWLVQGDYAERLPDPNDRRVVRVGLSASGREVYRLAQGMFRQQINQWLGIFTPQERATLEGLLRRLVDAMEKE